MRHVLSDWQHAFCCHKLVTVNKQVNNTDKQKTGNASSNRLLLGATQYALLIHTHV